MDDVKSRLANRVQLTTDGHRAYLLTVEEAFVADVDYAQLVKLYGSAPESTKGRYSPAECTGTRKNKIEGNPDIAKVSTSYVERNAEWIVGLMDARAPKPKKRGPYKKRSK